MPEIAHHDLTDRWNVIATFKVNGTATNPGEVSAVLRKPSGSLVAMLDGDPRIVAGATGVFTISDVGEEVGVHYLEVTGTTPAAGVQRFSFVVDPRWPSDLLSPWALTSIEECEMVLDRVGTQSTHGQEEDDKRWIASLVNTFSRLAMNYAEREFLPVVDTTVTGVNALDSATVNVASTTGFPSSGTVDLDGTVVTYTGTSATSLTGCSAHPATAGDELVELVQDRVFVYDGDGILSLAPYEAREASAVVMYSNLPTDARPFGSDLTEGYTLTGYSWYGEPRNKSESDTWLELMLPGRTRWCEVTVTGKWGAGVVPVDVKHVVEAEVANSYWASRVRGPAVGPQENYLPQQPRQLGESGYALDPRSMRILDEYRNHPLA